MRALPASSAAALAAILCLGYSTLPVWAWESPSIKADCDDDAKIKWTVTTTGADTGDLRVTLSPGGASKTISHSDSDRTSTGTFSGEAGKSYTVEVEWKDDEAASDSVSVDCEEKESPPPPPPAPAPPPAAPAPPPAPPAPPAPPLQAAPAPPVLPLPIVLPGPPAPPPVPPPPPAPVVTQPAPPAPHTPPPGTRIRKDDDNGKRGNGKTKNARNRCDTRPHQVWREAQRRGQEVNWDKCTFIGEPKPAYTPPPAPVYAPVYVPPPPVEEPTVEIVIEEVLPPIFTPPPPIEPEPYFEPIPAEFITGPPSSQPSQFPGEYRGK